MLLPKRHFQPEKRKELVRKYAKFLTQKIYLKAAIIIGIIIIVKMVIILIIVVMMMMMMMTIIITTIMI